MVKSMEEVIVIRILGDNMANKALRCPQVVENTYRKARELLEDYGVDLADLAEMLENADD